MSRENVEIVRRSNALFNAGDWDALIALFHPDVELRDLQHPPYAPEVMRGSGGRQRGSVLAMPLDMSFIANRNLQRSDVPELTAELDLRDVLGSEWQPLWSFALSFRGYEYFGGDNTAAERLIQFDDSVKRAFLTDGVLPKLDLALLRACLFLEQRRWCKGSSFAMDPASASFIAALLEGIRTAIQ